MLPKVDNPVVAGFWRCGCIPIYFALVIYERHQNIFDITAGWPEMGLETRIITRSQAFAALPACRRCAGVPQKPTDDETLRRLVDMRQDVLNLVSVMERISGR